MKQNLEPVVEHAGTGFAIPESMARQLDDLSDGLPKEFTYRRRSATASEIDVKEGERTDISYITTDAKDRDGEVVLPGGGEWKHYNRVVPLAHDYKSLPVGSNWWIRPKMNQSASGLIAKTHYPTKPKDWGDAPWMPSAILHLMQQPVPTCTGKSIGFLPLNIRAATSEEKSKRPDWKDAPIIDKWVGIEYSVVPVPCNDLAEMVAVSKALKSGKFDAAEIEMVTKAFGIKDMGGAMTDAMPNCPKCKSNETVCGYKSDEVPMYMRSLVKTDGAPPLYMCSKCKSVFSADGSYCENPTEKVAAAMKFNFIRPDVYAEWELKRQKEELAETVQREIENFIILQTGGLRI